MDTSKFVGRFIEEARKHVARMSRCLIDLEQDPGNTEVLQDLFRTVHTLKGSANMMGFTDLSDFSHAVEHVLGKLRDGLQVLDSHSTDVLLQASDALGQSIDAIERDGHPGPFDQNLIDQVFAQAGQSGKESLQSVPAGSAMVRPASHTDRPGDSLPPVESLPDSPGVAKVQEMGASVAGALASEGGADSSSDAAATASTDSAAATAATTATAATAAGNTGNIGKAAGHKRATGQSAGQDRVQHDVVVRGEKLDEIMRLVSELTVVNQGIGERSLTIRTCLDAIRVLSERVDASMDPVLVRSVLELQRLSEPLSEFVGSDLHALERTNGALKDALFQLRMVPLSVIFSKYPRIVREASMRFGKEVSLVVSGEDTELDKQLVDMIDESLMQMLRNAVDHGIETVEQRVLLGKSPRGVVKIAASYDRGMARITISDDGAGIPVECLARKAVDKRLISEDEAQRVIRYGNADAIADLVFTPGLSSAQIITDFSGRGVGMDIVHENIVRSLHGSVSVATTKGKGSTFTIHLPLNTAILQATVFRIGAAHLAVPTHVVSEVVRLDRSSRIEVVRSQALRVREQIVPVLQVGKLFNLDRGSEQASSKGSSTVLALLVRTSAGLGAVLVDDLIDQGSFLIHALPGYLGRTPWVSGCIVGAHDRVVLLVNTHNLMEHARQAGQEERNPQGSDALRRQVSVLVVDDSLSTREIEKSILESYGYVVSVASDGQEAFEMALDTVYDVVVTDIEMPRMDGFELTRRLRSERTYRHVPVILVTSRDSAQDKAKGVEVGADAYMVKSGFDQEQLMQTIEALVQ